eukprot:scaffold26587_cov65-Phaeocystis_antarctica.AAC.2
MTRLAPLASSTTLPATSASMVTLRSMQRAEPPWSPVHMSSANSYVPATSTILLTALSLSATRSSLELIAYREPGCSGGEGGEGGGKGGEGGEGGDGGKSGGSAGSGGAGGGLGGCGEGEDDNGDGLGDGGGDGGGLIGEGDGTLTSGSGEAASEHRCSSTLSSASPSELALALGTRRASARWSRNGAEERRRAFLRSTKVAVQLASAHEAANCAPCEKYSTAGGARPTTRRKKASKSTISLARSAPCLSVVHFPLKPVIAAALIDVVHFGVGSHGTRPARARVEAVGERAADGGQREVVVGAASEWHVQVALDVGEQAVTHLPLVDEGVAARQPLAVHEDRPVGEGVVVADDVRQVGVLLPAHHVGQHHARYLWCIRRYDCVDRDLRQHHARCFWCAHRYDCANRGCGGRGQRGHRKHLARGLVHRPHRGKEVGPADVLGVPHQHQLEVLPAHLLPVDRDQQLSARAARAGRRRRCFREPPGAREPGVDDHAALRHAPVLRVALPHWQRLWRRAADQRHDRSADPRPSAEHECRRAEQSEQRRVSRLALGHRRLSEALRAEAGATETKGWAPGCCGHRGCGLGLSSIAELRVDLRSRMAHGRGGGGQAGSGSAWTQRRRVQVHERAQRGRGGRRSEWAKKGEDIWHLVVWMCQGRVWRCLRRRDLDILDRGRDGLAPPRVERAGLLYAGWCGLLL